MNGFNVKKYSYLSQVTQIKYQKLEGDIKNISHDVLGDVFPFTQRGNTWGGVFPFTQMGNTWGGVFPFTQMGNTWGGVFPFTQMGNTWGNGFPAPCVFSLDTNAENNAKPKMKPSCSC